ncbi:hypothetical protein [Roseovarius sp.]|uniref:hypothetical protein n=1 Tax=Roseovarius sp. TaxID=1486281 RepID=UPI003D0E9634
MQFRKSLPFFLCLPVFLAACGNTVPEQALFGGAAGTGAAAVVGGSLLTGAAVGAAGNVAFCQVYPDKCL